MNPDKNPFPSDVADKFLLRLPEGMRERLKTAAKANNRTMNSEVVARLDSSFATSGRGEAMFQLHAQGSDGRDPASIARQLEQLPSDLSTQYGLHLYNTELKVALAQLEEAREESKPLNDKLQRLLKKEDGPPGPKARAKEAVEAMRRRISELENQTEVLKQTISNIHLYRRTQGLPELRNVREVAVTVRVGGDDLPERGSW